MMDDLIANHLRPGMSRSEVDALLGPYEAGGNGLAYYRLLHLPNAAHKLVSLVRWRQVDPDLEVRFHESKLVSVSIQ